MHCADRKDRQEIIAFRAGGCARQARVDTGKVKELYNGTYAGFAASDVAERLAGSVAGTVLPFAFHPDLTLIADPSITKHDELFSTRPGSIVPWRYALPTI